MWRTIASCVCVCFCSAGCNQDRAPQPDPQATESAQQAPDRDRARQSDLQRPKPAPQAPDEIASLDPNRFAGRDGIAEAREAIAAGKPPKLYMHVFNGVAPGWSMPGIDYCQPYIQNVVSFEDIPELAFSEGGAPPKPEPPNARAFATDFNKTMFLAHEKQIKTLCPDAQMD